AGDAIDLCSRPLLHALRDRWGGSLQFRCEILRPDGRLAAVEHLAAALQALALPCQFRKLRIDVLDAGNRAGDFLVDLLARHSQLPDHLRICLRRHEAVDRMACFEQSAWARVERLLPWNVQVAANTLHGLLCRAAKVDRQCVEGVGYALRIDRPCAMQRLLILRAESLTRGPQVSLRPSGIAHCAERCVEILP